MLDNLVTPVIAIAILLGITLPIWFLLLLVRLVRNIGRIADTLEAAHASWLRHVQLPMEVRLGLVSEPHGLGQPK